MLGVIAIIRLCLRTDRRQADRYIPRIRNVETVKSSFPEQNKRILSNKITHFQMIKSKIANKVKEFYKQNYL